MLGMEYARSFRLIEHTLYLEAAPSVWHLPAQHVSDTLPQDRGSYRRENRKLVIRDVGLFRKNERIGFELVRIEVAQLHRRVHRNDACRHLFRVNDHREFKFRFERFKVVRGANRVCELGRKQLRQVVVVSLRDDDFPFRHFAVP